MTLVTKHAPRYNVRLFETRKKLVRENMPLTTEAKADIRSKYARDAQDTGSPEVQIALLSARIGELTQHFQVYKKDNHSRRGLLKMVSKRRKLLDYLKRVNLKGYTKLIEELGIRG